MAVGNLATVCSVHRHYHQKILLFFLFLFLLLFSSRESHHPGFVGKALTRELWRKRHIAATGDRLGDEDEY